MYTVYEGMYNNMTKDLDSFKARKVQFEGRTDFAEKTNGVLDKMKETME